MRTKWIILISGILILGALGIGAAFLFDDSNDNSKEPANKDEGNHFVETPLDEKEDANDQTGKIEGVAFETGLTTESSELQVVEVMHKMTHQKIKAEEKWGAVPMIPDTINHVYEIVKQSNFEIKEDLLEILERWQKGDFSRADEDHNYFWDYQNGTIGKAYGLMSEAEEREFIIKNFGEEYLPDE